MWSRSGLRVSNHAHLLLVLAALSCRYKNIRMLEVASIAGSHVTTSSVMPFTIIGEIRQVQTIAAGRAIRNTSHLRKTYGPARWRKRKGYARVRMNDGTIGHGEVHWYEAHGIGKKEFKLKRFVED